MIDLALGLLARELDSHLKARFGTAESRVLLGGPVTADGAVAPEANDRLLLTLVNVEVAASRTAGRTLNLHLLVSASFAPGAYASGLAHLGAALDFFETHPVFQDGVSGASGLQVILEPLPLPQMQALWQGLGARYLPSLLYLVRTTLPGSSKRPHG